MRQVYCCLSKPQPILLRIRVSAAGRVVGAQVLRSSGEEELDRWVRSLVERYEYAPGLIDGLPVDMEYEQSIQIQARSPNRTPITPGTAEGAATAGARGRT